MIIMIMLGFLTFRRNGSGKACCTASQVMLYLCMAVMVGLLAAFGVFTFHLKTQVEDLDKKVNRLNGKCRC